MSRHVKISLTLLTLSLALPLLSWGQAAPQQPPNGNTAYQPPPNMNDMDKTQADYLANIPYFTLRAGMTSTLTLNNNAQSAMPVTVTVFSTEGRAQVLPTITLDPHSFKQIELRDVVPSEDFTEGNVQIAFHGTLMEVTSQISVADIKKHISFESREQGMMDFESPHLNGILSLPQKHAEGFLAVTNVSNNQVTIHVAASSKATDITLSSRETRLIKLTEEFRLHAPVATLVSLSQNGLPGDIITTGFVVNEEEGYSSAFTMVDPKIMQSSHLAGAHFRFGQPDPSEGFPAGANFSAPLLLANVTDKPVNAHVSADYTLQEKPKTTPIDPKIGDTQDRFSTVAVKDVTIAPGDVQRIELADELAKLGVSSPVKEAGIDIAYDASPGSLIGHLVSADQTGDYSFEVPIKDPAAMNETMMGVYPWSLENGARTVLHLKNATGQTVHAWTAVGFDGGTYNLHELSFQPYQTIAIDIQALKDSKKPDARGKSFPSEATHGQISWFQQVSNSLIGRAEQTDVSHGIARSFSCGEYCCANYTEQDYLSVDTGYEDPLIGTVGGGGAMYAYKQGNACNGWLYGPTQITPVSGSWSSDNAAVATVDQSGNVTLLSGGDANIGATVYYTYYDCIGGGGCHTYGDTTGVGNGASACDFTLTPDPAIGFISACDGSVASVVFGETIMGSRCRIQDYGSACRAPDTDGGVTFDANDSLADISELGQYVHCRYAWTASGNGHITPYIQIQFAGVSQPLTRDATYSITCQ